MKGMLAVELASMVALKRAGAPLRRSLVLLALADEEGGSLGMRAVAEDWDRVGCTEAINEGGLGITDAFFPGQVVHAVSVAERGVLWVELVATAESGHGAVDRPDEALDRLRDGIDRVERLRHAPRIDPAIRELLARAGEERGGVSGAVLRSRPLVGLLVRPRLLADPALRAALTDTVHLTGVRAGDAPNVVPGTAVATFDGRVLPGTDPQQLLERLIESTAGVPGLEWRVLQSVPARGNGWDGPTFEAIASAAVGGRTGVVAGPVLSVGFTDSLFLRALGVDAYGWVPFEVTPELAATMHGADERIAVDELVRGVERMSAFLRATVVDGG
jgi:acetylornithine deacetylase/succinyl-diaminopimelate desuccinylase-like protein